VELVKHWINGNEVTSASGRKGDVFNPALGTISKQVDFADIATIDSAV
jgi:malonate-semialdehyde dehydrogenase (acetylating)/methylmalonate-semialdehyde dehydrogenase